MSRALAAEPQNQKEMHESQYYDWLVLQAHLLRHGRECEADLTNIAQELEEMGSALESAFVSYFRQALIQLCKIKYMKDTQPHNHLKNEIAICRAEIEDRAGNGFSNPEKIEDILKRAWRGAHQALKVSLKPAELDLLPLDCPFTIEQTRRYDYFPEPLVSSESAFGQSQ